VFISEKDALVPAAKVERYFRSQGIPIQDFDACTNQYFFDGTMQNQDNSESENSCSGKANQTDLPTLPSLKETTSTASADQLPRITCAVFRNDGHGDWTDRPSSTVPTIVGAVKALCRRVETLSS
jgi:hypothetical protein